MVVLMPSNWRHHYAAFLAGGNYDEIVFIMIGQMQSANWGSRCLSGKSPMKWREKPIPKSF